MQVIGVKHMYQKKLIGILSLMALVILAAFPAPPAHAQGVAWQAEYFNNSFLLDEPSLKRVDGAIAFDWGTGSPAPGVINTDGFTVRWGADPYFPAGTYRFFALADDEVRVNVGYAFTPQINTFGDPRIGQVVSADVTLTEGVHHVQVDYREAGGNAYVFVTWVNLAGNPNPSPNFPAPASSGSPSGVGVNTGIWTAQYYANAALAGSPTLIQTEISPTRSWGGGSPVPSIPADNWSARWTSVQTLEAGDYQIIVRADDGVRVFVDGVLVINEWHGATGQTYTANLKLNAGARNFMIEYYEAGGDAFIEYTLLRLTPPTISPPIAGAFGVVNTTRLNVRSAPNTGGEILTKINRAETYPVVGRNADSTWWQINVNGVIGWVFGRFFAVTGGQGVPVTAGAPAAASPAPTGLSVTAVDNVNIRSLPNTSGAILGKLPLGALAEVVGRTSNSTWWQISYQGITGWVSASYARLQAGANVNQIPVTG